MVTATPEQFLTLLRRSGLIPEADLQAFLAARTSSKSTSPQALAAELLAAGRLTPFQVEQLLAGRWRGFELGNYRILDRLGQGGMGQVFLAVHRRMGSRVALKVLPPEKLENPGARERFLRESRATASLSHPNLVHAIDADHEGNVHFLVLEYIDGVNLESLVCDEGPMPVARAVDCIRQAAAGLHYAHERGLVHRDIKPANLVLDRTGTIKILDLGLAKLLGPGSEEPLTRLYDSKTVLGTADYLAPEQALSSENVDIRADIYSLGATLYFLLTGRPPYDLPNVRLKLMAAQSGNPPPVESLAPHVPRGLAEVLRRMMARDRDQRFFTPAEVFEALAPWQDQADDATPAPSKRLSDLEFAIAPSRRQSPATGSSAQLAIALVVATAVIAAVIALAVWLIPYSRTHFG